MNLRTTRQKLDCTITTDELADNVIVVGGDIQDFSNTWDASNNDSIVIVLEQ